jgi:hypothetical protein
LACHRRRRRQRTIFTQINVQQLDNIFVYNQYPDIELREALAYQIGVSESRIQVGCRLASANTSIVELVRYMLRFGLKIVEHEQEQQNVVNRIEYIHDIY